MAEPSATALWYDGLRRVQAGATLDVWNSIGRICKVGEKAYVASNSE
jgi:hypothetical protein